MTDVVATTRVHLHRDDYPATLRLLEALAGGTPLRRGDGWAAIGYEPTEHGAWVDWDGLATSWLSSTEKAVVHIARGCAVLEWCGGPGPRLREPLTATIAAVLG